jgi:hypothetical protein
MSTRRILCQLTSDNGEKLGAPIDLPLSVDKLGLEKLCQALRAADKLDHRKSYKKGDDENNNDEADDDDDVPYLFFVDEREITSSLEQALEAAPGVDGAAGFEKITEIVFQPQAVFKSVPIHLSDLI